MAVGYRIPAGFTVESRTYQFLYLQRIVSWVELDLATLTLGVRHWWVLICRLLELLIRLRVQDTL
jgi:hypothetical protein